MFRNTLAFFSIFNRNNQLALELIRFRDVTCMTEFLFIHRQRMAVKIGLCNGSLKCTV